MCAPGGQMPGGVLPGVVMSGGVVPGSAGEALRLAGASLDYLNSAAAADLPASACGEVLTALGGLRGKLAAAQAGFLRRFDAADGHDDDGYGSSSAWLAAMSQMSKRDARAAVRQMRQLAGRPRLADALAAGAVSESWAMEIAAWTRKLPADMREETDEIILTAAAAGASLDDLATIAGAAIEAWRSRQPDTDGPGGPGPGPGPGTGGPGPGSPGDPGGPDDGFGERYVQVGTTFGGAGVIRGDLTPECAAAVTAVLEALGKKHGPEDGRTEGQRFHDALQEACELLMRARMVPGRAGADTQVIVHVPLSQLRGMPGAGELEQAWLNARLGEPGYLAGKDAEAAACDALTVPVVTGHADGAIIDKIISLALAWAGLDAGWHQHDEDSADDADAADADADGHGGDGHGADARGADGHDPGADAGMTDEATGSAGEHEGDSRDGRRDRRDRDGYGSDDASGRRAGTGARVAGERASGEDRARARARARARSRPGGLSPEAAQALRYAIARLAIDFVSGPSGIAGYLRTGLLAPPFNTPSLPLDIGYSESIPAHIRRAVLLRDKGCAWPRCGRPAAGCDVHHLRHKKDGGETSVTNCICLCQYHHDVCVHREGWRLVLHPDGTTSAYGPRGQALHSHPPPATRAA